MTRSRRLALDRVLVDRGLAPDLAAARELIVRGLVTVGGAPALGPSRAVSAAEPVVVLVPGRFVGRGGEKLAAALVGFGLDVAGRAALDVGSSTGGFTDCLLQAGAARVLAVDVGRDQLHERLRDDARVVSVERTNVRDLDAAEVESLLGARPTLLVADVSFASLAGLALHLVGLVGDRCDLVVLVKPQFELESTIVSRGRGVVREPGEHRRAVRSCTSALGGAGAGIMGVMASPITGASGNAEFFVHARRAEPGLREASLDEAIDAALEGAPK